MILSAQTIRHLCSAKLGSELGVYPMQYDHIYSDILQRGPLITPFSERTRHEGFTYGLGPCGYDIRIAEDLDMYPGNFCLASSIEQFRLPDWLCMKILDKSTWARLGLNVKNTVAEPGWCGYLTLELTNEHETRHIKLARGMPIAQVQFEMLDYPTIQPYSGKYQNQREGAVPAILEPSEVK